MVDRLRWSQDVSTIATRVRHCCPMVMTTYRYGAWVICPCGWRSPVLRDASSASAAWAEHVAHNDGDGR